MGTTKKEEFKNEYATAYVTQLTNDGNKSEWEIYSEDKKKLGSLPKFLNEQECFAILHLIRNAERVAFNNGVNFQKVFEPREMKELKDMAGFLKRDNEGLRKENVRLADILEKTIT